MVFHGYSFQGQGFSEIIVGIQKQSYTQHIFLGERRGPVVIFEMLPSSYRPLNGPLAFLQVRVS